MMMEENSAGPGSGVVHRRHRQRGSNGTPTGRIPTHHLHAASSTDDVSISSDDSKKVRYNKRRRFGRLLPSKGTLIFWVVLIIGSSIAALIFLDGSPIVTDHGGSGGYGSSLRGRGVQLAKEVGNRLEKHCKKFQEARGAREGVDKKQKGKNHDGSALDADASEIGGALDYAANQPLMESRGSRSGRASGERNALPSEDDESGIGEGGQERGGNPTDEEGTSRDGVEEDSNAAAVTGDLADEEEEGGEDEEKREESEHYWVIDKTYVDVYNTSLPENRHLAVDLSMESSSTVAHNMVERISLSLEERIEKMFEKATTNECRTKIAESFGYYLRAFGEERALPFENVKFKNGCFFPEADSNVDEADPDEEQRKFDEAEAKSWSYQPPRDEAEYIDKPENLNILYAILAHGQANETIRLINTLREEGHTFVIHVDGKEIADSTHRELSEFASTRSYVHVLPDEYRVRVNWGGFTMVNATLQVMRYALAIDRPDLEPLEFHKFVHMSATAYPIKSNKRIRQTLSEYPIDANLFWVLGKPTSPHEEAWHYFVECDDAVHRIYRMPPKRWENSGIDIMTSSQWFIASRDFVRYLAEAKHGTFAYEYTQYTEHVIVADEQYFGTILRHTEFCHKHHNTNFLFLEFGEWENFMHNDTKSRDVRKCLMPDPERCGRSPKTITKERILGLDIEEIKDLFGRKFSHKEPDEVKEAVDKYLRDDERPRVDLSFGANGALVVAKETAESKVPLCLGLDSNDSQDFNVILMHLRPCFLDASMVEKKNDWYKQGVRTTDVSIDSTFHVGRCSSDGNLTRDTTGQILVTPGIDNPAGPRCFIRQRGKDGEDSCLESVSNSTHALGFVRSRKKCRGDWKRTFFFGDDKYAPRSTIHLMVPRGERRRLEEEHGEGHKVEPHICFALQSKELNFSEIKEETQDANYSGSLDPFESAAASKGTLQDHAGNRIITTPCSRKEQVIEWIFVPILPVGSTDADTKGADHGVEREESTETDNDD